MGPRLTLICPSYERHYYLERSFRFWSDRNDINVIYADGSQSPLASLSKYTSNVSYIHQPISVQQRTLLMLDRVDTPYVCMMCDDEFYLPSSLQSCIEYLEANPDYSACMGRSLSFRVSSGRVVFGQQYPRLRDRALDAESSLRRLTDHFSEYVPSTCYAVIRTEVFRSAMKIALNCKIDIFAISEIIFEFLVIAKGKTRVLPQLYWLRSHEAPPIRNTGDLSLDTSKTFDRWWFSEDPSDVADKSSFCCQLAKETCLSFENVYKTIDLYVHSTYFERRGLLRRLRGFSSRISKFNFTREWLTFLRYHESMNNYLRSSSPYSYGLDYTPIATLLSQGVAINESCLAECVASIEAR